MVKKLEKAIRKVLGKSLAFDSVDLEEEEMEEGSYKFCFQVDDRIFNLYDEELVSELRKALKWDEDDDTKDISSDRVDAYPSGHAAYEVSFYIDADA